MRKPLFLLLTLVAASCISNQAWAGIVYNNLGVADAVYDAFGGTGVLGSAISGIPFTPGFSFTPASTVIFSELDIALSTFSGTNSVTVNLMSDAGGLPGSLLESWSVNGLPPLFTCCTLQTLSGSGATTLNSGTPYWVTVFAGGADTIAVWNANTTGAIGTLASSDGAGWTVSNLAATTGAFEVLGAEPGAGVPEPGTTALALAAGVLALMMRRPARRRS